MTSGDEIMSRVINECMTTAFAILPGHLTPTQARVQLAAGLYGVVMDEEGVPLALVVTEDLVRAADNGAPALLTPAASLPPSILVGSAVSMQEFGDSGATTLFDIGAHGAVVTDDTGVAGVLPVAVVDAYLGSGEYTPPSTARGESGGGGTATRLGGSFQTPVGTIVCTQCGFINTVHFIVNLPLCQNTQQPSHTLQLPGGKG
jgi:hypothetical protein